LDYFGIELAAVGGTKYADYAFNLTANRPATRRGSGKDEQRVYLTWEPASQLREFDELLLQRAGIDTEGRYVMQFLPPEVVAQLLALETANADGIPARQWQRTIFGVRKHGTDFEFYIEQQIFRPSFTQHGTVRMSFDLGHETIVLHNGGIAS
jgi:hypothetical protein